MHLVYAGFVNELIFFWSLQSAISLLKVCSIAMFLDANEFYLYQSSYFDPHHNEDSSLI